MKLYVCLNVAPMIIESPYNYAYFIIKYLLTTGALYGLSCLDKHLIYFYQGGYASGPSFSEDVKNMILKLCKDLKADSVSIIDGLAPNDYVVNSVLGKSDGQVCWNICHITSKFA